MFTDKLFSEEYLEEKRKKEEEFLKSLDITEELKRLVQKEIEEINRESEEEAAETAGDGKAFEMYTSGEQVLHRPERRG